MYFLNIFTDIFTNALSDGLIGFAYQIFVWMADLYGNIMTKFVNGGNQNLFQSSLILTAINAVYTLAAVFMLFRVVISLLSYLVEPDQVKDKTTGGGKLVTRIIIVILLILLTMPNGQQTGLLFRTIDNLQTVLLGRYNIEGGNTTRANGIIDEFFAKISENDLINSSRVNEDSSTSSEETSYNNNLSFVDTIYAKTEWESLYGLYGEENDYNTILYDDNRSSEAFGGGVKCAGSDYAGQGRMRLSNNYTTRGITIDEQQRLNFFGHINYFNTCDYSHTSEEEIKKRIKDTIDNEKQIDLASTRPTIDCNRYSSYGSYETWDNTYYNPGWCVLKMLDEGQYQNLYTTECTDETSSGCYTYNTRYVLKSSSDDNQVMSGYLHNQISDVEFKLKTQNKNDGTGLYNASLDIYVTYIIEVDLAPQTINCYYAAVKKKYDTPSELLAIAAPVYIQFTQNTNTDKNDNLDERFLKEGWHISKIQNESTASQQNLLFFSEGENRFYTHIAKLKADNCHHSRGDNIKLDNSGLDELNAGKCPSTITNVSCTGSELDWECSFCSGGSSKIKQSNDIEANTLHLSRNVAEFGSTNLTGLYETWGPQMTLSGASNQTDGGAFPNGDNHTIASAMTIGASYTLPETEDGTSPTPSDCGEVGTEEYQACIDSGIIRNTIRNYETAESTFVGDLFMAFIKSNDNRTLEEIDPVFTSRAILVSEGALDSLREHDPDDIGVSAFMAIIMGLVALVFFAVLAVDVVVRNCKLILLEIMSPIAILAYLNPKDKILGQWTKQFVATFVDLFLKLIAIKCIGLFVELLKIDGIMNIFVILGVLTFSKIIPDFISKIFGIKDAAGTFKDSFKMVKAAGFAAAGGAIAFGRSSVGIFETFHSTKGQGGFNRTASIFQSLGTVASSTLRGMGGGSKGNLTTGWQYASNVTGKRKAQYESGVSVGSTMLAGLTMGLYNPNHKDEQIEKAYDDILTKRKILDEHMEEEILKGKDRYRTDATQIKDSHGNYIGIKELGSRMSMQELQKFKNSKAYLALDSEKAAAFDKFYAEKMNEAKAIYLKDVLLGKVNDVQTKSNAETYDRTVKTYKQRYGKKEASQKQGSDQDYKYDFEALLTTDKITNGSTYKRTKSQAEDDKITFSGSATRNRHHKQEKANNNR